MLVKATMQTADGSVECKSVVSSSCSVFSVTLSSFLDSTISLLVCIRAKRKCAQQDVFVSVYESKLNVRWRRQGLCSRLLFLLPAVLLQKQPASVWLCVIDRRAFSSMWMGADLKQALPCLTECPSPTTHLFCSLKKKGEKGTECCSF